MSRTYHHFSSRKLSKIKIEKGEISPYYWHNFYKRSPSKHRKETSIIPNRRKTKQLAKKQILNPEEDYIYPHRKKPVMYYW